MVKKQYAILTMGIILVVIPLISTQIVQSASAVNLHIHNTGISTSGTELRYVVEKVATNTTVAVYHFVVFPGDEELTVPLPGYIIQSDVFRIIAITDPAKIMHPATLSNDTNIGFINTSGYVTHNGEVEVWFNIQPIDTAPTG